MMPLAEVRARPAANMPMAPPWNGAGRCAQYLELMLANWSLTRSSVICTRHTDDQLPDAYLAYWPKHGFGALSGLFRSAET
jgi:hypothetical protein